MTMPALPLSADDLATVTADQWQAVLDGSADAAAAWIGAAARLGHAPAQAVLGQWLLDGHGLERDPVQAFHWFFAAAQQGHAMGMNMLGRCHELGWGTSADAGKAAAWYRKAAETGLDAGMYNIANLLASGQGVARDHAAACGWYQRAAALGHAKSMTKLGRYHEDGLVLPKDPAAARRCYERAAHGGDFRGQFCFAGMLAAEGRMEEALAWLHKVPATATRAYLEKIGKLLQQSPQDAFRRVGRQMLDRATL